MENLFSLLGKELKFLGYLKKRGFLYKLLVLKKDLSLQT